MEAVMRAAAFAAGLALLAGCSSAWQSTEPVAGTSYVASGDAVLRYAGRLRRLVLLPALFEPIPPDCAERFPTSVAQWMHDEATRFLVDWKGYEVIEPVGHLPDADVQALSRQLGQWQERDWASGRPPETLRVPAQALARSLGADGVIVIHAAPECPDWGDMILNLLAIGMPSFYGKLMGRNFSVGIYDAASGSLVWQRYQNLNIDLHLNSQSAMRDRVEIILGSLENAVPGVLLDQGWGGNQ
jgi:hypothetical protein